MQVNTEDKNLIKREANTGFFGKVRMFFKNLFKKDKNIQIENIEPALADKVGFAQSIKVESEVEADNELLEIQRKVRAGEIRIDDLTEEQENQLIDLYDKQIAIKKAKIEELKKKIEKIKKAS